MYDIHRTLMKAQRAEIERNKKMLIACNENLRDRIDVLERENRRLTRVVKFFTSRISRDSNKKPYYNLTEQEKHDIMDILSLNRFDGCPWEFK